MTKGFLVRLGAMVLAAAISAPGFSAAEKLIIISPHRKSIQDEFVPGFKDYYKQTFGQDVEVEWLDQGGTSDDIRFLRSKFASNPKSSGIDIFWGGGAATFVELDNDKLLEPYQLSKDLAAQIPALAAGVPLIGAAHTWYASAMSSFGIFYNRKVVALEKLPEPKSWEDIADAKYIGQLSSTDPRHSGSSNSMMNIVLQSYGWDKGWDLLTRIAANTRQFTQSSSDPIKSVTSGDASAAMAIDFYALAKIGDLGRENLGFVLPQGQTILDPDPIAIIRGATNRLQAERFVEYVLSANAQRLLILPKGSKGGPKLASLGRMAINPKAYDETETQPVGDINPFKQKAFMQLDMQKASAMKRVLNDLVGAAHVDVHKELVAAWKNVVKKGSKPESVKALTQPPISETEALALAKKWDDPAFRNDTINKWLTAAKASYAKLAAE